MRTGHRFPFPALLASLAVLLSTSASAQMNGFGARTFGDATIHGNPPSVTSFGFGGHPGFHGVPPSVTSLNFGNVPLHGPRFGARPGFVHGRRHFHPRFIAPFFAGGYYFPYDYDDSGYDVVDPGVDDAMEQNYRRGPTIFDRNGELPAQVPEDYRSAMSGNTGPATQPPPAAPVSDQPDTVLVFKDGHELDVKNYAIVGPTLYDLSDGRTRKVQLAELDLAATVKHNDDRGVSFQLPAGSKLN